MKTIGAGLLTHYEGEALTLARLWKITRTDAQVFAFTDHDESITYSGTTYAPTSAFDASAVTTRAELNVDNLEAVGLLDSAGITAADIEAGLWDGAAVELRMVNWANLADGAEIIRVGELGQVSRRAGQYVAEMRGLMQKLQNNVGRLVTPDCDAVLGDARCGVSLGAMGSAGTVTSVTSRRVFTASALVGATDHFAFGEVVWSTGANAGLTHDVKTNVGGGGAITLQLPAPYDIAIGDTFTIYPGCDKSAATCKAKFSNLVNFRGFPDVPGPDRTLLVGGQ